MIFLSILLFSLFISFSNCFNLNHLADDITFHKKTNIEITKNSIGFKCSIPDTNSERNTSFSGVFCKTKSLICFNYTYENGLCWADWNDLQKALLNDDTLLRDEPKDIKEQFLYYLNIVGIVGLWSLVKRIFFIFQIKNFICYVNFIR